MSPAHTHFIYDFQVLQPIPYSIPCPSSISVNVQFNCINLSKSISCSTMLTSHFDSSIFIQWICDSKM